MLKPASSLRLIGSILLGGAAVLGAARGIKQETFIHTAVMAHEDGFAYVTVLSESGDGLIANLGDSPDSPNRSTTELFENDQPLGPAHSAHEDIGETGGGLFSHWGSTLLFFKL